MTTIGESFELDRPFECLRCNHKLDMAAQAGEDDGSRPKPEAGGQASIMLCFNCGYVMIVDKDGELRAPSRREMGEMQKEGMIVTALAALCGYMRQEIDKLKEERKAYAKGTQAVSRGCPSSDPADSEAGRDAPGVPGTNGQRQDLGGGDDR